MQNRTLKLGTRKSLLAWAQSGWVAREIEKANPGVRVEQVGIETKGDVILDVPLRKVEGKEFFVKEIDDALLSKAVDFTVHSMKDLSLDRPADLKLACIPKRAHSHDVIVFSSKILDELKTGKTIRIGTSSPRRLENMPFFLKHALPFLGKEAVIEFVEIRGNVNTRLSRLHETDDRYLSAVVLALAGLDRLMLDETARPIIEKISEGTRKMLIPLSLSPTAPAQGALAVECRADDAEVFQILRKIHDVATEESIEKERAVLAELGGGCHQRFGASQFQAKNLGPVLVIRGKSEAGKELDEWRYKKPGHPGAVRAEEVFSFSEKNSLPAKELSFDEGLITHSALAFVSHSRALTSRVLPLLSNKRIFTAGFHSWKKCAAQGLWVEGCVDALGEDTLTELRTSLFLNLPKESETCFLTHSRADLSKQSVATYEQALPAFSASDFKDKKYFFWMSRTHFLAAKQFLSPDAVHASGLGKTNDFLTSQGVPHLVFPNQKEWEKWLNVSDNNSK